MIAKRLYSIVKELEVAGAENPTKQNIEKYCEEIERSIIEDFNNSLSSKNFTKMKVLNRLSSNAPKHSMTLMGDRHVFKLSLIKTNSL